jgi:cell division protein FtsI/penicillin-binding protein 2
MESLIQQHLQWTAWKYELKILQGALVAINPKTGGVLAGSEEMMHNNLILIT